MDECINEWTKNELTDGPTNACTKNERTNGPMRGPMNGRTDQCVDQPMNDEWTTLGAGERADGGHRPRRRLAQQQDPGEHVSGAERVQGCEHSNRPRSSRRGSLGASRLHARLRSTPLSCVYSLESRDLHAAIIVFQAAFILTRYSGTCRASRRVFFCFSSHTVQTLVWW